MRITDDSDETFREDMLHMRLLMNRIMRTLYANNLRIDPKLGKDGELDESSLALRGDLKEITNEASQ